MLPSAPGAVRRLVYNMRSEGAGRAREATAIGAGAFIGCTPFYGFHLAICLGVGSLFRLNRLKLYLAANISNPFVAPFLLVAELQAGAWLRRGEPHALTLETVRTIDPWIFGGDLLLGSLAVGAGLGTVLAIATWMGTRPTNDPFFELLARRASDRYVRTSITAWEFARAKLRRDPVYRTVLTAGVLPPGGALVEIGCGQGLMLALLLEASRAWTSARWPPTMPPPPRFDSTAGIELRPRVAALARQALGAAALIIEGDAREHPAPRCRAVLCLDVLHMVPFADQEALLVRYAEALDPDGVILVREADASARWRFYAVSASNRAKALAFGNWRQTFHFRAAADWTALFERLGFSVVQCDAGRGTPFGNVLFALRHRQRERPHARPT